MPVLTLFAGPNGSGKSSIIRRVHFAGRGNLLEADAIAARIHAADPRVCRHCGRPGSSSTNAGLSTNGDNFAIETTLSGIWSVGVTDQAIARGFFARLVYICLDSPERCIQRVRERVAQGGHSVRDQDVRRRYARSLSTWHRS